MENHVRMNKMNRMYGRLPKIKGMSDHFRDLSGIKINDVIFINSSLYKKDINKLSEILFHIKNTLSKLYCKNIELEVDDYVKNMKKINIVEYDSETASTPHRVSYNNTGQSEPEY